MAQKIQQQSCNGCVSVIRLPRQMENMKHDEGRIGMIHQWIETLCDPYSSLLSTLNETVHTLTQKCLMEDLCSDSEMKSLQRQVGSFTVRGITARNELETLQEESDSEEEDAVLEGPVTIRNEDDSLFEGNYSQGCPHGYFRQINSYGDLDFFGCFYRGTMLGVCWKSLPGGGFLISKSWDFSDSSMIYLYPDCRTGLHGEFRNSDLVSGRQCELENFVTLVNNSIPVPVMSQPTGDVFSADQATQEHFSRSPHLPDPYEAIFVEVNQSNIKDAGEGLFAKTDIEAGTIISFYNGLKVKSDSDWERPTPYKMFLEDNYDIDIPDSMTCLSNYNATLGHKVCHSFKPNSETDVFYHPRFGLIRCIATLKDIRAGQEILINYGYNLSVSPTWYKVAWAKHQKVVRGLPDWKTALRMNNMSLGSRRSSWLSDYNALE